MGEPPWHDPLMQTSPVRQASSLQGVVSSWTGKEQFPEPESQLPAMWHTGAVPHALGAPVTQTPPMQTSGVHMLLSLLHVVPSALTVVGLQVPEAMSHACGPAHAVAPEQLTMVPAQEPP